MPPPVSFPKSHLLIPNGDGMHVALLSFLLQAFRQKGSQAVLPI